MRFEPPRCPLPDCPSHHAPTPDFYRRRGSYRRQCHPDPVPRFECRTCSRTFSRQTFRADYRDHRPECNVRLVELLVSGVGLRQCGRILDMDPRAVQMKFRKLARVAAGLHGNFLHALPGARILLLDELETFEHKSIWPLSVAVLIDHDSMFMLGSTVAPIRRAAARGTRRRRLQEIDELQHGRRQDRSRERLRQLLSRLRDLLGGRPAVVRTDLKGAYAVLIRELFGAQVVHERSSGRTPRDTANPLFRINNTHSMMRERNGRLHRQSWLVSKREAQLAQQLVLQGTWRNYCWARFNHDLPDRTPAVVLGLISRRMAAEELVRWRQDWGERSIHPFSVDGRRPKERLA